MTSRPHDALFKAAFELPASAGALFQARVPDSIHAAIDWRSIERESGSFIDPELADRHSDLLFKVRLAGQPALLYLLLEHQSTVARDMPLRLNDYLTRIWKRYDKQYSLPLPPLLPLVVSHAPEGWTASMTLHGLIEPAPATIPGLAPLLPNFTILVLDLAQRDDAELRGWTLAAFAKLALVLLRDARDPVHLLRDLETWRDLFREVLGAPSGADAIAQLFRYIALVSGEMRFEEFFETIDQQLPETREIAMTIAEQLRQQGLEQGLQQGLQQGHQQGLTQGHRDERAQMLVTLSSSKFGDLSAETIARIEASSFEELGHLLERILTSDSLEALFAE